MEKSSFIYILTNKGNKVLYTGVTSNLEQRLHQHRTEFFKDSFTSRYKVDKLVYYEEFPNITDAIAREKKIKSSSRKKKIDLIKSINPSWQNLWEQK
jgi:putative endonuclease